MGVGIWRVLGRNRTESRLGCSQLTLLACKLTQHASTLNYQIHTFRLPLGQDLIPLGRTRTAHQHEASSHTQACKI